MLKKPELLVDYNSNSYPISATCSACGVQMPLMESKGASQAEGIKWFAIQFDLHVRHKHSREDFSQKCIGLGTVNTAPSHGHFPVREITRLQQARTLLSGAASPAAKKRVRPAVAVKAVAAKLLKKKRRKLSPEGRARIAAAAKARWARARAAKK
jgi:hypothetical protein